MLRVSEKPIIHSPKNPQINQAAAMNGIERERGKQPSLQHLKMTAERKHDIFLGTFEVTVLHVCMHNLTLPPRQQQGHLQQGIGAQIAVPGWLWVSALGKVRAAPVRRAVLQPLGCSRLFSPPRGGARS